MFNRQKEMTIYVIMGLLEAGKTSLIKDLLQTDLYDPKKTHLILACEEGEEEYEPSFLSKTGSVCEDIEKKEDLTGEHVMPLLKKYDPDDIIIEYNGMWLTDQIPQFYQQITDICFDRDVYIQTITVMNDETFGMYMKNMSSFMTDQFRISQLIIDNRCSVAKTDRRAVRGSIKAVNPRAQISFESEDDAFYDMKEELPYDMKADVIDVPQDEFGTWYVDMVDNVENYKGRTLKLRGIIQKPKGLPEGYAVLGRRVMTCCAQDIQFMGFMVRYDNWDKIPDKKFAAVTAKMDFKYMPEYEEEGPVFYADDVEVEEPPKDDMVYFNGGY